MFIPAVGCPEGVAGGQPTAGIRTARSQLLSGLVQSESTKCRFKTKRSQPFLGNDNVKQKAEPKTEDSSAGGDSKKSVNTDNINSETALLEAQIKELKAQLRAAELKACAYETMVNVAEKKFGIAIRKKHGAKQ